MYSGHELDDKFSIEEVIARSRQIVNDSLELTKRSQDRFKLPFAPKDIASDIVPYSVSPANSRLSGELSRGTLGQTPSITPKHSPPRHTPSHTPKSPSFDFEGRFLSHDSKQSVKQSWETGEEALRLESRREDIGRRQAHFSSISSELRSLHEPDQSRLEFIRLKSEVATEIRERRQAEARVRELEETLDKVQGELNRKTTVLRKTTEEAASLVRQLDQSDEARTHLQAQLSECQESRNHLQRLLEQREHDVARLESIQDAKNSELLKEVSAAQEHVSRVQEEFQERFSEMQEDLQQRLKHAQTSKADTSVLLAKLDELEAQLNCLKRVDKKAEVRETEPVSLRKLHEIEAKLTQTTAKYDILAEQLELKHSPSQNTSRMSKRSKEKGSERTLVRRRKAKSRCQGCLDRISS
jgi:DNA repair exonuclease SbcCD ATPase subunit